MISFAVNLFVYLAMSLYFARKLDGKRYLSWWIILFLSISLVSVELLGIFGLFNAVNLLVFGFLVLFSCLGWEIFWQVKEKGRNSIIELVQFKTCQFLPWKIEDFIVLLITFSLSFIVALFSEIIPMSEIDSIGYHLPILSNFLSTQNVWEVFHAGYVGPNTFFPANHEAIQAFFAVFTEEINLGFIVNLLPIFLFYGALRDLTRKYNVSKVLHLLVVLAVASVPFLFNQLMILQVDLFMFCLFGSATAFIFSSVLNQDKADLAKSFLVLGLMVGAKYNGIPQAIMLLPLLIVAFVYLRKSIKIIAWYPLLSVLTGGFWYIRNWIVAGNPIYPFGINLGVINFEGHKTFIADTVGTSLWHFFDIEGIRNVIQTVLNHWDFASQVGKVSLLLFPFTLIISLCVLVLGLFYKKFKIKREKVWITLIFLALFYLFLAETFYYLTSPYTFTLWNQTIRYSSPVFAVLPIALILSACYSRILKIAVFVFAFFFLTYNIIFKSFIFDLDYVTLLSNKASLISIQWFLVLALCIAATIGLIWLSTRVKNSFWKYVSLFVVTIVFSFYQFQISDHFVKDTEYDDAFLVEKLTIYPELLPHLKVLRQIDQEAKGNIALVGLTPYWLFEKEGFQPFYVNIDGCVECAYFDYRNEDKSVRTYPDVEKWKDALKQLNIQYLIIDNLQYSTGEDMHEEKWAKLDTSMFEPLFMTDRIRLYRITLQDA